MRPILVAALLSFALPARAEQEIHRFSVYVSGLKAGTLQTVLTRNGKAFSVSGTLSPTQFVRKIRDVGFAGQSAGTFQDITFTPRRYSGHTKTGSRASQVQMRWSDGTAIVDRYAPNREAQDYAINPAKQRDTLDPLTAVKILFVDQSPAQLCNKTLPLFDDRKRGKLSLAPPTIDGESAICAGTYTRLAGFSPQDTQERVNFPFTLMYTRINEDTYRLIAFTTKATFGSARAKRK